MTHDPYCPLSESPDCRKLLTPVPYCACELIAAVRADERKTAPVYSTRRGLADYHALRDLGFSDEQASS